MKNIIYKKVKLAMLLTLFITFNSCKKDSNQHDLPTPIGLQEAKNYINNYLNKSSTNVFSKMNANWNTILENKQPNDAILEVSLNNSERIFQTSSLIQKVEDNEKRNNVRLILFKNNATSKINYAVYMSIINDGELMDLTKIGYKQSNTLTGKILFYNLEGRFINGWHYTKGKIDQSISPSTEEAYKQSLSKINSKLSASKSSNTGNDKKISRYDLPEIICHDELVPTYGVACVEVAGLVNCQLYQTGSDYVTYCEYVDQGGGNSGGGTAPGGGGSPRVTQNDIDNAVIVEDEKPNIADINKYSDCFRDGKQARTYTLTIYVDQPVPNQNDQWIVLNPEYQLSNPSNRGIMIKTQGLDLDVGHSFVCFEKNNTDGTNVRQTLGFYPNHDGSGPNAKGAIKDNSGSLYDLSYKITVTESQFNHAMNKMKADFSSGEYKLRSYNCTDAAVAWMNAAGAGLAGTPRGGFNNTPGDFGQALRQKPNTNKNAGSGPSGKGPCN